MKKIALLVVASLALFSCGDDDSGASALKPSTASVEGTVLTFSYDSKNRMQSMSVGSERTTFTYNAKGKTDRVTTGADFSQFNYDSNNKLISIVDNEGDSTPVTQTGDSYIIGDAVVQLTPNGDLSSFDSVNFTYGSGKGPFANVKSLDMIAVAFANTDVFLFIFKKRITTVTSGGQAFPYVYSDGEKGLPATATVSGTTVTYTYSN